MIKRTLAMIHDHTIFKYSFTKEGEQVICSIVNCPCKVFRIIDEKHYSCNYCRNILIVNSYENGDKDANV